MEAYVNSANMKLCIFSESETQVINIMLLWCFMSSFELCRKIAL